ncbi:hypothetical protein SDC9_05662 [bioreactor metagenome]|uniref:Rhodanese domain-containing protein n=1 Tax=bioreactor metagenome TaxID=1076179 RepID=A0A644SZM9_9ZZZZ|nr:rhodanese-like domain-containing protein [Desulfovibrio desulfuricans]MEA4990420.1 rhodanese-like domain-containing protein [Desulfovibrio desulfuricans]
MRTAGDGIALYHGADGTRRLLKIIAALLVIACAETCIYWKFSAPTSNSSGESMALSPEAAREYVLKTEKLIIIDVRSQKEFADGHLPNAVNMPLYAFQHLVKNIPQDSAVLLHCQYGYRALQAYKLFRRLRPDINNVRYAAGQLHFSFLQKEGQSGQ